MPEPPDFEHLAREAYAGVSLLRTGLPGVREETAERAAITGLTEQLRLVWNARGAADRAQIESDLSSQMGATAAGPYVKNLDRALRSLDR